MAIAAAMVALDMTVAMRALGVACVAALCTSAVRWRHRLLALETIFEVSPFALSAIAADGSIRRIIFGAGCTLRNDPRRRCLELSTSDGFSIEIPHDLVGFSRLAELVVHRGGFVPADAEPPQMPTV